MPDVPPPPERPAHRPHLHADLTELIDAATSYEPQRRAEVASSTAEAVLRAGRSGEGSWELVALAETVGLDTLAELWRDAEPVSLAGSLWSLYLLRQWCHANPADVARLWRAGAPLVPADAAVAGLVSPPSDADVTTGADAILAGAYRGDFAVALERAAALFRVSAAGRRWFDEHDPLADRNDAAASALAAAAARWRAGRLI